LHADDITFVESQQATCVTFVDGYFEVVADAKQAKLLPFGHVVIVPAHLVDGFVAPEIQRKVAAALYVIEQLLTDVADYVAERIDKDHASTQAMFFHNGLYQCPVDHRVYRITDVRKRSPFRECTSGFGKDIRQREMQVFKILDNIQFN